MYKGVAGDDMFMHSMIKDYALEEATPDGKPSGKFVFTKTIARNAAHRILKEHMSLEGAAAEDYLNTYFDKTWGHFDVNQEGKVEVSRMASLYRFLTSN